MNRVINVMEVVLWIDDIWQPAIWFGVCKRGKKVRVCLKL